MEIDIFENLKIKQRENNLNELRKEINKSWVTTKIKNHLERNTFLSLSVQDLKDRIMKDDLLASFFIKDPSKQNFTEIYIADFLSKIESFKNFKNLASNSNLFLFNGNIVEKRVNGIKSIDYTWDFNDKKVYASQKYIKDNGGAQDNQFNDMITFLENTALSKEMIFIALIDGAYFNTAKISVLKKYEKENVIVCSYIDVERRLNEI